MLTYEQLCERCRIEGIDLLEVNIKCKGLYGDNTIALSTRIDTTTEKRCILAEEIGHYATSTGDILDQSITENRKQEYRARTWGHGLLIPLEGIIAAHMAGCRGRYELAEFLDVTEGFLLEAITAYKQKYGLFYKINDQYTITFEPLGVLENFG